jgi:hypothetical protein
MGPAGQRWAPYVSGSLSMTGGPEIRVKEKGKRLTLDGLELAALMGQAHHAGLVGLLISPLGWAGLLGQGPWPALPCGLSAGSRVKCRRSGAAACWPHGVVQHVYGREVSDMPGKVPRTRLRANLVVAGLLRAKRLWLDLNCASATVPPQRPGALAAAMPWRSVEERDSLCCEHVSVTAWVCAFACACERRYARVMTANGSAVPMAAMRGLSSKAAVFTTKERVKGRA